MVVMVVPVAMVVRLSQEFGSQFGHRLAGQRLALGLEGPHRGPGFDGDEADLLPDSLLVGVGAETRRRCADRVHPLSEHRLQRDHAPARCGHKARVVQPSPFPIRTLPDDHLRPFGQPDNRPAILPNHGCHTHRHGRFPDRGGGLPPYQAIYPTRGSIVAPKRGVKGEDCPLDYLLLTGLEPFPIMVSQT